MELRGIVQALLFSTSEPLAVKDFKRVLDLHAEELEAVAEEAEEGAEGKDEVRRYTVAEIGATLSELAEYLEQEDAEYRLVEESEGWRMSVAPQYAHFVRLLRNDTRPLKLSNAAMETLSLIAYRQPMTRAEMEMIRGVSVDSAIGRLLEHDLIHVSGRANLPGKPRLYSTTEAFLNFCGIVDLSELPASDVLSPEQLNEWVKEANKRERVTEQELGLPTDSPEGEGEQAETELEPSAEVEVEAEEGATLVEEPELVAADE